MLRILVLSCFFVMLLVSVGIASECPTADALQTRIEENMEKISKGYDEMIDVPDRTALEGCIKGFSFSDSFSLGIPSLSSLFQAICNEINAATREQISALQEKMTFSPLPGFSFSAGGGLHQTSKGIGQDDELYEHDVKVSTKSSSRAREILDVIKEN